MLAIILSCKYKSNLNSKYFSIRSNNKKNTFFLESEKKCNKLKKYRLNKQKPFIKRFDKIGIRKHA